MPNIRAHVRLFSSLVGLIVVAAVVFDSGMAPAVRLVSWGILVAIGWALVVGVGHPRARAWLEFLSATLGLPITAAYGFVHVIEGAWVAACIGLVGAIVWVIVLAAATIQLWRGATWSHRAAGLVVGAIALQLVVMPVAAGTGGGHPPRMPIAQQPPDGAQAVSISVDEQTTLNGWYTPTRNGAAVVLLPGADGNRAQTIDHARVLAAHGFGVLALDARGSGDSRGLGHLWGWTGDEDISAALNWLDEQEGVATGGLGVVGLSMGGEQALTAAAMDHRIHAVVAEGVQARVGADTWYMGDDPRGQVERIFNTVMWDVSGLWAGRAEPRPIREVAQKLASPVLIIAADAPDERAVSADLASLSPYVEVWQTEGIGHTQALALAPGEWEARVTSFLERTLAD